MAKWHLDPRASSPVSIVLLLCATAFLAHAHARPVLGGSWADATSDVASSVSSLWRRALAVVVPPKPVIPRAATKAAPAACTKSVGGAGGFKSVQAAVNSVGRNSASNPVTICIAAGVYTEKVTIEEGQDGITLLGEGLGSVISGADSQSRTDSPFTSATLIVKGNFFGATNLKVENTHRTLTDPSPAVALYSQQTTWEGVSIEAWDDTLAIHSGNSHLFKKCHVSGDTDFIWGFGRAAFVDSSIEIRKFGNDKGNVAVFGTDKPSGGVTAGAVFWNCNINGAGKAFLGRPYRPKSIVVYANCFMGGSVIASGWGDYKNNLSKKQFDYREYNSRGPGAGKRSVGQVLQGSPPAIYTVKGFIGRE